MSPIGRIFIVLNLILSAAFLGWAANALATTEDSKQELENERARFAAELDAKDDQISQLNTEKDQLENDARTFREQRDQTQANADGLQSRLDEATRQNGTMQVELASISATLGDYNSTIAQLTQQKDDAIERAHEAERARDEAVDTAQAAELARRDAEEAARSAQLRIGDLEATRTALEEQVASLETRMQVLVSVTGVDPNQVEVQPQIEAAVLNVRHDLEGPGLVMLNVGSEDGVKRGFTFEVYRGSQYKGQVRAENVQTKMSWAIITRTVPGTTISQGDRAATHL